MRFPFRRDVPIAQPEWLVVGLGNPGAEYAGTRHNLGFRVVELLAQRHGVRLNRKLPGCPPGIARAVAAGAGSIEEAAVVLAQPQTYMNLSGRAVAPLARFLGRSPERVLVVYDDMDLPPGRIRVRSGGGAGGHNGIRSLIGSLQTQEFPRVRIGVGRPAPGEAIDHVLSGFSQEERPVIDQAIPAAADAVETILRDGLEAAMNRYNP